MFRLPLLDPDRVLLLTPRWADSSAALQVLLLAALALVPLGLVVWLYRYEARLVTPATARTLLFLRGIAIALLVFLVGFQPVYARYSREELPGRVILAVDVSESMGVTDPQREPLEKLKLARALKLGGDLVSGKQLGEWIEDYEAKREPRFAADEFAGDPAKQRQAEAERRKAHDELLARMGALTRSQAAKQLLSPDGLRFLARLQAKHQVEIVGFAADTQDVTPEAFAELFARGGKRPARVGATDLGLPLVRAAERSGEGRGKVLGVVLMTDGQHNGGEKVVEKAEQLKKVEVPLYPVAFGADKPPPDVTVMAATAPPSAFKDVDAPVKVRFRATGLKPQDLLVKVFRPGEEGKPLDQKTVKHDGTDQEYNESLQVRLDKEGQQPLVVSVTPQGKAVKETNDANNSQTLSVNVADDRSKVLLVDGEARWEFHYLWNALLRDPSMKVKSVVYSQPRIGKVDESELAKANAPALTLPEVKDGKDPLADYDCVILGDVLPEQLPPADRERLEKYVGDRGGSLVVLAGKKGMPLTFLGDDGKDALARLLPVEKPRVADPVEGFPVTLTEEGKQADFLRLEAEGTTEDQLKRWAEMPRHYWGVVGKAKPGATTLATVAARDEGLKPKEQRERDQESALFVRHNYGFGRVFFVGVDSTWRYRYRVGDTYHHRFWSQTIRWAATDKPLVTGNDFVRFGTPQPVFRDDEAVGLTVRFSEELKDLPADLAARARVFRKDADGKETSAALVTLKPRPSQPRVFDAQVRDLPAGKYEIELAIPELEEKLKGKDGPLRAPFTVTPGEHGELVQLATNMTLLKEMADKNGTGKVYTPETAGELLELLEAKAVTKSERDESPLWKWWPVLVLVVSLLSVEWVIRKWSGLP